MTQQTLTQQHIVSTTRGRQLVGKLAPVIMALMLGAFVIGSVGFASGMAHNAAHDTRHVMVFPCH
jgi:cobalt transporter subunit CbtB